MILDRNWVMPIVFSQFNLLLIAFLTKLFFFGQAAIPVGVAANKVSSTLAETTKTQVIEDCFALSTFEKPIYVFGDSLGCALTNFAQTSTVGQLMHQIDFATNQCLLPIQPDPCNCDADYWNRKFVSDVLGFDSSTKLDDMAQRMFEESMNLTNCLFNDSSQVREILGDLLVNCDYLQTMTKLVVDFYYSYQNHVQTLDGNRTLEEIVANELGDIFSSVVYSQPVNMSDPDSAANQFVTDFKTACYCNGILHTENQALSANFFVSFVKFLGIHDPTETLSLVVTIQMSWSYPLCVQQAFLQQNVTGKSRFELNPWDSSQLWKPTVWSLNNVKDVHQVENLFREVGAIDVYPDDMFVCDMAYNSASCAKINASAIFQTRCDNFGDNLLRFPFDIQNCGLEFQTVDSRDEIPEFSPDFYIHNVDGYGEAFDLLQDDFIEPGSVWNVIATCQCCDGCASTDMCTCRPIVNTEIMAARHYKASNLSNYRFNFTLILQRDPTYWICSVIFPCVTLQIVQIGSFLLPPRVPERPTLTMVLTLSFMDVQRRTMAMLPETSNILLIEVLIGGQIALGVLLTVYTSLTSGLATFLYNGPIPISPINIFGKKLFKGGVLRHDCLRFADAIASPIFMAATVGLYYVVIGGMLQQVDPTGFDFSWQN